MKIQERCYTSSVNESKGISLVEAIIALTLLFSAILLVITLIHSARRHRDKAKRLSIAVTVSENAIATVRQWARDPANFDSDWSSLSRTYTDPEWSSYPVTIEVATPSSGSDANLLFTPCEQVEVGNGYPPENQRRLSASMATIQTTCQWGASAQDSLVLVTNIGEPDREVSPPNPLASTRTGATDPVPINQIVEFETTLLDSGGSVIPDMMFSWSVQAHSLPGEGPGSGTLTVLNRTGTRASLKHIYIRNPVFPDVPPDNPDRWQWVGGWVSVNPRCRYKGKFYPIDPALPANPVLLVDFP